MSSEDLSSDKTPAFDHFARDYDTAITKGLKFTGETKEYFAEKRALILSRNLSKLDHNPASILDFGCGTGTTTPLFRKHFSPCSISGTDPSEKSLEIAHTQHAGCTGISFIHTEEFTANSEFDLAYCNGVFHHIIPAQRQESIELIYKALTPGGYFSFWENNPWNPMTRFIMKRVPFDSDAILVWPRNARRNLARAGFRIISTSYAFIFPSALRAFRFLEPPLCKLPLGGQYHILCRKPDG